MNNISVINSINNVITNTLIKLQGQMFICLKLFILNKKKKEKEKKDNKGKKKKKKCIVS